MRIHISLLAAVSALGMLCACGVPGVPQPPSLNLPQPVTDLAATRKGDKVTLTWTPPRETTDQETVRRLGVTKICRQVGAQPMTSCTQIVGQVAPRQLPAGKPAQFTEVLPRLLEAENPTGLATYAVVTENPNGRAAGLSNQVKVALAPVPEPPSQLEAKVTEAGVEISAAGASSSAAQYHLFRRSEPNGANVDLGAESPTTRAGTAVPLRVLDRSAEWEHTYWYHVTPVVTITADGRQYTVPGDDSPSVEVFVHDIFPPAAPTGLQAVYSPVQGQAGFIDLTWRPNTESDLAGYNVYRHEEGAAPVKINSELVKTPAFRDEHVEAGKTYFYSVTAVDLRGNESGKSVETSESAPKD